MTSIVSPLELADWRVSILALAIGANYSIVTIYVEGYGLFSIAPRT